MKNESSNSESEHPPSTHPAGCLIQANGLRLFCRTLGSGPPIMLLHGGPGADHSYFLPYLEPMSRTHELILFDQRGCGRSEHPDRPEEYTLDNMVEDTESLRSALGLAKVAVLGHSFGGILAQSYALSYPDSLSSLILVGTAPSAALVNRDFDHIKETLPHQLKQKIEKIEKKGIFRRDGQYYAEYARLCERALLPYNYVSEPRDADSDYQSIAWPVLREMWVRKSDFRIDGNLRDFDFTKALKKLRIPTLIVNGEHELVSARSAHAMYRAISGSQLTIVPNGRHMIFVDHQTEFLATLSRFLDGIPTD